MPREELKCLLEAVWPKRTDGDSSISATEDSELGIGLDCCIRKTRIPNALLVQTTDFFFPLVDDPYVMGKITCANVLSDLFALGVTHCDNMLMLLGVSTDLTEEERKVVVPMIMRGFSDAASEASCPVTGGQTVKNPWMLIGGAVTSVVPKEEIIPYNRAVEGDLLVLTKPLGTRLVGNAYQWYDQKMPRWEKISNLITIEQLTKLYLETAQQMALLNLTASKLMHEFGAHACTDVTGFGILGHAQNLASFQKNDVSFVIHTLPLLKYTKEIAEKCEVDFKFFEGLCAETSGGLLIALPADNAQKYCQKLSGLFSGKEAAWIVGEVVKDKTKTASISKQVKLISADPIF